MTAPTINMVTTTATATEPDNWSPSGSGAWGSNSEITTSTKLDFGTLNIDANAWTAVKATWAYVASMGTATTISNMGFYVDGTVVSGMTHYDKIATAWENPSSTGNEQQSGSSASATVSGSMHTVLESDETTTITAALTHTQYIFVQYYVLSTTATGTQTTGVGTGRPIFAFTYS